MGFWIFLLVCSLLIPAVMIVAGFLMWKHPPKKNQWILRLPHYPFHEKSGYLAVCPPDVRQTVVENRMDHVAAFGYRHAALFG